MPLPLHLLRLFAAVADQGGVSRAAETLHISQPAVSKGVRQLEEQLGIALLDRVHGRVKLTEAGTALAARARELFAVERVAEEELRALRGLRRGTLTVGASTSVATYHLPPLLAAFHRRYPDISLSLTSANTRAIVELLGARELDIAMIEGPTEDARVRAVPWKEEELILIAAASHRFTSRRRPVNADEFADELFIVREPGSGTREVAETILRAAGFAMRRTLELGSTEAIKQAVAADLGVALVSTAAAADQLALGRLRAVSCAVPQRAFRRVLFRLDLSGRRPTAAAAAFNALLDQEGEVRPAPRHA